MKIFYLVEKRINGNNFINYHENEMTPGGVMNCIKKQLINTDYTTSTNKLNWTIMQIWATIGAEKQMADKKMPKVK